MPCPRSVAGPGPSRRSIEVRWSRADARRAYTNAINHYPGSTDKPWGNAQIGNIYKASGDYANALTYYERALNNLKGFTDESYEARPAGLKRDFDRKTTEWLRDSLKWQVDRIGK